MDLNNLKIAIQKAWSKETSYSPDDWNESNPSIGQCAVTALILNDYFEGDILWVEVIQVDNKKISHYFNQINNTEIDLTRDQFPRDTIIPKGVKKRKGFSNIREFMLSDNSTKKRYELLKNKVIKNLENK